VRQLGYNPETFFARTFFTYSHDDAIRAVADGLADGAAVDSLVYDFALAREPALAKQVRVIGKSMPFGAPPVVVGPGVRPQLRAELYELLITLHQSAEGRAVLQSLGVDRFIAIDDSAYESARQIEREANPIPNP
jgi:phosphonate transport system substrate-binding protein